MNPIHDIFSLNLTFKNEILKTEILSDLKSEDEKIEFEAYFVIDMSLKYDFGDFPQPKMLKNVKTYLKFRQLKEMPEFDDIQKKEDYDYKIDETFLKDEDVLDNIITSRDCKISVQKKSIDEEFFGFNEPPTELIHQNIFQSFFLDNQKNLIDHLNSISFEENGDTTLFRNRILNLFFSALKKHSIWDGKIAEISSLIFEKKQIIIWHDKTGNKSNLFNTQFLLHYFLNFSLSPLKMLICNSIQELYPIPMIGIQTSK